MAVTRDNQGVQRLALGKCPEQQINAMTVGGQIAEIK